MGFLSEYEGTERVQINQQYWVDIKKNVATGEREDSERALASVLIVGGKATPNPDVAKYRQLLVLASIAAWNLDDDNGQVWPIDLKHVKALPGAVFDLLWAEVDRNNAPAEKAEQLQFRAEDGGGDPAGDTGAAGPGDVPAPEGVLAAPGDDAR
jgi:hypothetical protein